MNAASVIEAFRRELLRNIKNEFARSSKFFEFKRSKEKLLQKILVERIKADLSFCLEKKGIDIRNMQISLKPDNSNVTVCIRGD